MERERGPVLHERLLRQRTPQECGDGARDLVARPAKARILDVPRFRQRRARRLPDDAAGPFGRCRLSLGELLELEQQRRVLVAREEPEEEAFGELEGAGPCRPGELEEAAILRYGPDFLDPVLGGRREPEEVPAPDAAFLLPPDDGKPGLRFGDGLMGAFDDGRIRRTRRSELGERAVPDRLAGAFEQPAQRDPVLRRKFQRGLPLPYGGSKRRKISSRRE
jgi:hypothetical protein